VLTNQGSARVWPHLAHHPLDFHYNPSTMGGAIPLALGLALAQPTRDVLVVSGDGSLLMSLGSLVTVVAAGVRNMTVVVLNNGLYEVTGSQKTAAAQAAADLAGFARAAGFPAVARFETLHLWQSSAADWSRQPGPRFLELIVEPTPKHFLAGQSPAAGDQIAAFQRAIAR
jgi:thiamine pyrophosphate-dependent acetolactate synthase large subunit-like protein